MVSKVIIKRSTTVGAVPISSDLDTGELAINTSDKRLFSKHEDGEVFRLFEAEEANLNSRMDSIDAVLTNNTYTPFIARKGTYFDQSYLSTAATTTAGIANTLALQPFVPRKTVTIDQIGISIVTGVGGASAKLVIFTSDTNGGPLDKWWEGSTISCSTATYAYNNVSLSFNAGTIYWLGVHTSANVTLRAVPLASTINLGLSSSTGTAYNNGIRRSLAWGISFPGTWVFSTSEYVNSLAPISVRMRVA